MSKAPKKYLLVPGYVKSQNDDDAHYISATRLALLYQVSLDDCEIYYADARHISTYPGLIRLKPRHDGDYTLPWRNEMNNEPAFPLNELNHATGEICEQHFGLTLRDYFAAKAMNGIEASQGNGGAFISTVEKVATRAYELADAMLRARNA